MTQPNTLQRFLFDGLPVRGALVKLDSEWQQLLLQCDYPATLKKILGEMLAATVLLAANIKFDGTLILQIHGSGPLRLAVAECSSERTVRVTAKWNGEMADLPLGELLGSTGHCLMILEPKVEKAKTWQGIVSLEGDNIGAILENYMRHSEQLDTRLMLASSEQAIAGMLLQRLPDGQGDLDGWRRVTALGQTVLAEELLSLDASDVLRRLFYEETVQIFEREVVRFSCTCSRERVSDMLALLGNQEVGNILLEQGSVEIRCDFCQQRYVFDEDEVNKLFGFNVIASTRETRH